MDKVLLLKEYVDNARVMQLATVSDNGPWVCHVWYAVDWSKDRLLFTSRTIRTHSAHIALNDRVAGGILDMQLSALGQPVQGVTFTGSARIVSLLELASSLHLFCKRWPAADLAHAAIASGATNSRLYEVLVDKWVLHDEVNLRSDPRFELVPTR